MRSALALTLGLVAGGCMKSAPVVRPPEPPAIASANTPPEPAAAGPRLGQSAPEIAGEDTDGVVFRLSDYRGKVVVLDFWGHW